MKNKKSQIFEQGTGWVILVIVLAVVLYMGITLVHQGSNRINIECNNYQGKCVDREDDCKGNGMTTKAGMGCEVYCCFNASKLVKS